MATPLPDDLQPLMEEILEMARNQLAGGRVVPPTWFLIKREPAVMLPMVIPFSDAQEKHAAANRVRAMAVTAMCDCIVFICEGWGKKIYRDNPDFERLNRTGNIRDEPDRVDVLMISVETYDGFWGASPEVHKKGRGRVLEPFKFELGEHMGAMTNYLPPRPGTVKH